MSLRVRLAVLYAIVSGGILLLFGVLLYLMVGFMLVDNVDAILRQTVRDILEVTHVGTAGDLETVYLPTLDLTANVHVQLWTNDGRLQTQSSGTGQLSLPLDPEGLKQSGHNLLRDTYLGTNHMRVLSVPLRIGERPVGVLQVATSLAFVDSSLHDLTYVIVIAAAISMLLAGLAGWYGIGQALSPLKTVTETAWQITRADDLSRRIPYHGASNDEIGQLITAFNETLQRLEGLFGSQQRFLADVSHELRTPLTVIKGNADLIRRIHEVDEESLTSIEQEADRLTRMVGDLLLLAQAESGKLPLAFRTVELDTLLLEVFKEMSVFARERVNIKITDLDQVQVWGDPDRLKQVLLNLVSNAIQYTPDGGEVFMSLGKSGNQARLVVRDTGPGIPAEDLPHIFERFYRAEKSRSRGKVGGFGLGLSIVYWIVTNHGGRIDVSSRDGSGTTFCIYLPQASGPTGNS
ncbi:MAG: HAMP domain-containing protein [Chloroflexi bacterium]|nr:HAMP domain-containing protein [Chloroflexota bacterium]